MDNPQLKHSKQQTKVIRTSLNPVKNLLTASVWAIAMIISIYMAQGAISLSYEGVQLLIDHQVTTATVYDRRISTGSKGAKSFRFYYRYQIPQTNGTMKTYRDRDVVPPSDYEKNPKTVEIMYATQDPTVTAVVSSYRPFFRVIAPGLFGLGFVGASLYLLYKARLYLIEVWYAFGLWRSGKCILGEISRKSIRKHNKYDIWYQYGDSFEVACEVSKKVYNHLNQGDSIEVRYLPTKPHISRPHPRHVYLGWW